LAEAKQLNAPKKSFRQVLAHRKALSEERLFSSMLVIEDNQSMNMQGDLNAVIVLTEAV